MKKHEIINVIQNLYPTDSQFADTNAIGKQLMLEAIEECKFDWRDLPIHVLRKWAEKCEAKEQEADRKFNEKYK